MSSIIFGQNKLSDYKRIEEDPLGMFNLYIF